MILPTWLLAIGKGLLGFLRGVPWQVWAGLALIGALWLWGNSRETDGREAAEVRCQQANEAALRALRQAEAERDHLARKLAQRFAAEAEAARIEIRAEFNARREVIQRETHRIEVGSACMLSVPERLHDVAAEAVAAANAARGH